MFCLLLFFPEFIRKSVYDFGLMLIDWAQIKQVVIKDTWVPQIRNMEKIGIFFKKQKQIFSATPTAVLKLHNFGWCEKSNFPPELL